MLEILIYIVLGIIAICGIVITVFNLPGVWLVYLSTLILAMLTKFEVLTPTILIILFAISLFSTFLDNISMILGAKNMGASTWGMVGAVIGGIVGLMVGNLVGFFIGPIIGATFFEVLFQRKTFGKALKAGIGSFLGILLSIILRLSITVGIVIYVVSLFI
mgnify:FL=1